MTDYNQAIARLRSSALGAATVRAFAALEPDEKVRNPDYLAREFLDPELRPDASRLEEFRSTLERVVPGAYFFQNGRTMYFDARMSKALDEGFEQIVLLGAGLDTRAYRLRNGRSSARFFEVDLPELQVEKKRTASTFAGTGHVEYLPLDFNTQPLDDIAKFPQYDASKRTYFHWEGVSYYLTADGVDATFAAIRRLGAPGSRLALDYMPASMVDGSRDFYGAAESRRYMASVGEPLRFGIEDADLERFLSDRGFTLLNAITHVDLEQNYLIDSRGQLQGRVSSYVRIAEAETQPD